MTLRTITGKLTAWGGAEANQNGALLYSYLRFETSDGSDGYFEGVMTLPVLDSLLRAGGIQTFYLCAVRMPRMFGSKKHHVLYAVRHQGRTTEAIHSSSRLLAQQKVAALKLFFFGLFLIPLWGAGLVLWIWGLRLLAVGLPIGPMQQELKRAVPTPS
jgi:hypothetical protein